MPQPQQRAYSTGASGVVRHTNQIVALADALAALPQTERIDVAIEHDQTGKTELKSWNRIACCVALRKGAARDGVFGTAQRARAEGFGLVTTHPTLPHLWVFFRTSEPTATGSAGGAR